MNKMSNLRLVQKGKESANEIAMMRIRRADIPRIQKIKQKLAAAELVVNGLRWRCNIGLESSEHWLVSDIKRIRTKVDLLSDTDGSEVSRDKLREIIDEARQHLRQYKKHMYLRKREAGCQEQKGFQDTALKPDECRINGMQV
jgi:hypothetical protein